MNFKTNSQTITKGECSADRKELSIKKSGVAITIKFERGWDAFITCVCDERESGREKDEERGHGHGSRESDMRHASYAVSSVENLHPDIKSFPSRDKGQRQGRVGRFYITAAVE